MEIVIYETYDYHTKSFYWWTGRDKSSNCFEIRKNGEKFNFIVNDILHSSFSDIDIAFAKMKSMYDNGGKDKKFRVSRK